MATEQVFLEATLTVARSAADVANFCDHVEHNELSDRRWVTDAAAVLRRISFEIAESADENVIARYVARLREVERRNPTWDTSEFDGGAAAEAAVTWRDLQAVQASHDRRYHPDVAGLSKLDQLRHYALHLSKLTGALAAVSRGIEEPSAFYDRRLPDLLLFGLKLSTVMGERLPAVGLTSLPEAVRTV